MTLEVEKEESFNLKGFLEIDDQDAHAFRKRYFLLDRDTLEYYREDPSDQSTCEKIGSINIKYITQVAATTQKTKKEYCFEINTIDKKYFLAAPDAESMEQWVNALHKAAVNPKSRSRQSSDSKSPSGSIERTASNTSETSHTTYKTSIVGGVVVKIPIQHVDSNGEASDTGSLGSLGAPKSPKLRFLKDGWCFKQGAVMKNWKRRYFTLSVIKLSYFENKEDKEPIKSILTQDIKSVTDSPGFSGRENVLEIGTPYRTFYLQADKKSEMREWIKAIQEVMKSVSSSSQNGPVNADV